VDSPDSAPAAEGGFDLDQALGDGAWAMHPDSLILIKRAAWRAA